MPAPSGPDPLIPGRTTNTADGTDALLVAARTSRDPAVLVAAALIAADWPELLDRATTAATGTRDRQLVAIAAAYLHGDDDRTRLLARDHLADHPDAVLVAHIAALSIRR
jgi:hypothetical protein